MKNRKIISALLIIAFAAPVPVFAEAVTASKPAVDPARLQMELDFKRLGIPTGTADGAIDSMALRAVCVWRELTGREASRNFPTALDMQAITATNVLALPKTMKLGLNVNLTCQTAIWKRKVVEEKIPIWKVSTGQKEFETLPGNFKVGWLVDGWYESRTYPEGWMYRPQFFNGGQAIHGTRDADAVHSYPASHGCVRMKRANVDYLWANGFDKGSRINVYGRWIWQRTH